MKKSRVLSLLLAVILAFSCCITAFADTYSIDIQVNAANHITLNKADKNTGSFSIAGSFVVIAKGEGRPEIQITYDGGLKDAIALDATANENGFICEVCEFPLVLLARKYDVKISSSDSKKCDFDFWIIDADRNFSGLTADPDTSKTYYEDIDVKISGTKVSYINGAPDFSGAEFSFRDKKNKDLLKLTGADVLCVMEEPVYGGSAITYKVKSAVSLFSNNKVVYKVKPNPIKAVKIASETVERPAYHFGKDGIIKGTLRSYYFRPDMKFDGITFTVTYKDSVGGGTADLEVQKDAKGYYVEVPGFGRQDITYKAEVTQNKTQPFDATVTVGGASFQMTIQIEKAKFFEFIGIWFRLLFGRYR